MKQLLLLLLILLFSCAKIDQNTDPIGKKVSLTYELEIDSALVQPYDYLRPPTDGFGYVRSFDVSENWTIQLNHYYTTEFRRAGFRLKVYEDSTEFTARVIADGLLVLDTTGFISPSHNEFSYLLSEW